MPIKNSKINLTFEDSTAKLLSRLALHEHKSVANIAQELILEALEHRENMDLSVLAASRDLIKAKRIRHKDLWK